MTEDTHKYLSLFSAVSNQLRSTVQKLNWLNSGAEIPENLMKWLYFHHGMPYAPWAFSKRDLPRRFEEFHASRHTVTGFVSYFEAFSEGAVEIYINAQNAQPRGLLYLSVSGVGLPNAEMLANSEHIDQCFYLYKDQPVVIEISVDGSAVVGDFVRQTAKLEIPFGDDPNCEITVNVT